jgi:hypothetical protein
MNTKCATCGVVLGALLAEGVVHDFTWAPAPGCPRAIGCTVTSNPHPPHSDPPLVQPQVPTAAATSSTSASTATYGVVERRGPGPWQSRGSGSGRSV